MSTALAPMEEFKERVLNKLKTDIGSLMPDVVLAELVQQAVKESFFKKTTVPKPGRGSYSNETIEGPSWFQAEIISQLEPILREEVRKVVETHQDMIKAVVTKYLEENRLQVVAGIAIGEAVKQGMMGAGFEMVNALKNQGFLRNGY